MESIIQMAIFQVAKEACCRVLSYWLESISSCVGVPGV